MPVQTRSQTKRKAPVFKTTIPKKSPKSTTKKDAKKVTKKTPKKAAPKTPKTKVPTNAKSTDDRTQEVDAIKEKLGTARQLWDTLEQGSYHDIVMDSGSLICSLLYAVVGGTIDSAEEIWQYIAAEKDYTVPQEAKPLLSFLQTILADVRSLEL